MSEIERIYPKEIISIVKERFRPWIGILDHHTWKPAIPKEGIFYAPRINLYHKMNPLIYGVNGLGYDILIGNNAGLIEVGKRWIYQLPGAHCRGKNYDYIGIGVVGDYDNHFLPAHMYTTLRECHRILMEYFRIPVMKMEPHSKYSWKTCPGKLFPLDKLKLDLVESKWCRDRCPEFSR